MPKRHAVRRSQRSVVARIEEIVLASSGADAFELVFSLVAARLAAAARGAKKGKARAGAGGREAIAGGIAVAAKMWPGLEASASLDVPDGVLAAVGELLDGAAIGGDAEALDAVFEQLVTRVGKGDKGQFFTPRHVVDWIARSLLLARGERVVDPACGSGAFLVHARAAAPVETWGFDVDRRAVRVARLIAVASGDDPARIVRTDSLARGEGDDAHASRADVILTNPPFAGDVAYEGYAVARAGRKAERDALFVERCVEMLRPGGRLAIVLPHNKVAGAAWSGLREWLVERARVFAVVSLPRETFLPHTAQKAVVVFAKKRDERGSVAEAAAEKVLFAVSERAGKDAAGEPITRAGEEGRGWRGVDHDLDGIGEALVEFLRDEGFAEADRPSARSRPSPPRPLSHEGRGGDRATSAPLSLHGRGAGGEGRGEKAESLATTGKDPANVVVLPLSTLGPDLTLAPERHRATHLASPGGVPLSDLVAERADRVLDGELATSLVFDTTHARDGLLDVRAALRATAPHASAKKLVRPGDLLVSRLRPYLRQIALAHPALAREHARAKMACSTEFYVLAPKRAGESLAFLLPWLLGDEVQAVLAAAQEGGHHPRVPKETLLALRVPDARVRAREAVSARVERGIADLLTARRGLARLIEE